MLINRLCWLFLLILSLSGKSVGIETTLTVPTQVILVTGQSFNSSLTCTNSETIYTSCYGYIGTLNSTTMTESFSTSILSSVFRFTAPATVTVIELTGPFSSTITTSTDTSTIFSSVNTVGFLVETITNTLHMVPTTTVTKTVFYKKMVEKKNCKQGYYDHVDYYNPHWRGNIGY